MRIASQKRKEILSSSFEILKDNYRENAISLRELIGKMSKVDLSLAFDMWKYLINAYPGVLHSSWDFSFLIMYEIEEKLSDSVLYEAIANDTFLKNKIFHESGNLNHCPLQMIEYFIEKDELTTANELLELAKTNKYKENSLYFILDGAMPSADDEISEAAFDLLNEWVKKVKSKEERTKLNLRLLDFIDDEDEDEDDAY